MCGDLACGSPFGGSMIVVALLAALLAFVVVPISREIERRKRREE